MTSRSTKPVPAGGAGKRPASPPDRVSGKGEIGHGSEVSMWALGSDIGKLVENPAHGDLSRVHVHVPWRVQGW